MLLCIVYAVLSVDSVNIHRENYWGGRNALEILISSINSINIYSI